MRHDLPTLDELASDPARAMSLSAEARSRLLVQVAAILTVLGAPAPEPSSQLSDRLLKVDEAAGKLGVSVDYVYRHASSPSAVANDGGACRAVCHTFGAGPYQ